MNMFAKEKIFQKFQLVIFISQKILLCDYLERKFTRFTLFNNYIRRAVLTLNLLTLFACPAD